MEKLYGNYLGLCINNNDPQKRGRVQIFIPHIMPALYDYWNKEGVDINISCVGDNLSNSLTTEVIDELRKILPWAESASPILGSSSPGTLTSSVVQAVAAAATGGISTIASAAVDLGKKLFEQSPVAVPPTANKDQQAIAQNAAKFGPLSPEQLTSEGKYTGNCGQGARQILGGMTNNPYFQQGLAAGSGGSANAGSLSQGNNYLQKSGLYQQPASVPSNYVPQKGDVITGTKAGGAGHIQVYDGTGWVSDTRQKNYLTNYGNLTLHRMNDKGLASVGANAPSGGETVVSEQQSQSGTVAAASPMQSSVPCVSASENPSYGSAATPEVQAGNVETSKGATTYSGPGSDFTTFLDLKPSQRKPEDEAYWRSKGYNIEAQEAKLNSRGIKTGTLNYSDAFQGAYGPLISDQTVASTKYPGDSVLSLTNPDGTPYNPVGKNSSGQYRVTDTGNASLTYNKVDIFTNTPSSYTGLDSVVVTPVSLGNKKNSQYQKAHNNPPSESSSETGTKMVNKTDPHGPTAVVDMNNMAKGVFSYPAPGALLWVFFQDGNPLFPVYFAANYGAAEWQSAYRYGSPGPGYQPEATPENPATSTGGIMNLNGVGGLRWENTNHPSDTTQSQKSISLFGEDGSNMFIGSGYHQIFSKFDRRDQVEGDRFNTTLGYKEEWVQGDDSKTVMGDVIVRIGNVSKPAVDAVTRIQQIITEIQKPLAKST